MTISGHAFHLEMIHNKGTYYFLNIAGRVGGGEILDAVEVVVTVCKQLGMVAPEVLEVCASSTLSLRQQSK